MHVVKTRLPRGLLTRLLRSRARLDFLDRQVVVSPARAEHLAVEAIKLQRDLEALAGQLEGSQGVEVQAMIGHALALERRYTEAGTPTHE